MDAKSTHCQFSLVELDSMLEQDVVANNWPHHLLNTFLSLQLIAQNSTTRPQRPKMADKTLASTAAFASAQDLRGPKLTSDLSKIPLWELHYSILWPFLTSLCRVGKLWISLQVESRISV